MDLDHPPVIKTNSVVLRRRILALLREYGDRKVVVIQAPAGFGKTTLLRQYCDVWAAEGGRVAWARMDARAADPSEFIRILVQAVESLVEPVSDDEAKRPFASMDEASVLLQRIAFVAPRRWAMRAIVSSMIEYRLELDMRYGNQRVETAVVADVNRLERPEHVLHLIDLFHTRYGERFGRGSACANVSSPSLRSTARKRLSSPCASISRTWSRKCTAASVSCRTAPCAR
ncbi:MAG: AAA family ATPase [Xanthobacteraceae bacterium]|nr:AAA family ATPase [Xanthobacteraceae bacterium]